MGIEEGKFSVLVHLKSGCFNGNGSLVVLRSARSLKKIVCHCFCAQWVMRGTLWSTGLLFSFFTLCTSLGKITPQSSQKD